MVCLDSVRSSRELHCDLVMDADLGLSGPSEVSQSAVPGGVAKEADSGLSRFGEVFKKPVSLFSE